jgi:hypothetical protein
MSDKIEKTSKEFVSLVNKAVQHDSLGYCIGDDDSRIFERAREINAIHNEHLAEVTPISITPRIFEICRAIDPGSKPTFLETPSAPTPPKDKSHAIAILQSDSPFNSMTRVPKYLAKHENCCEVFGWIIWEARWWFDCQPHSVAKHPDGRLEDVTAQVDKETRILFLPDTIRIWTDQGEQNKLFPKKVYTPNEIKRKQIQQSH